jgi:hypothetical protein
MEQPRIKSYYEGRMDERKDILDILNESIKESESMAGIVYPAKIKQIIAKLSGDQK